jgi:hypothetical protein
MFNHFRHVDVVKRIGEFSFSFFVKKSEATHGRIKLAIKRMVHPRTMAMREMRRNNPRGSFAKKVGRNASKGKFIFVNTKRASKGPH